MSYNPRKKSSWTSILSSLNHHWTEKDISDFAVSWSFYSRPVGLMYMSTNLVHQKGGVKVKEISKQTAKKRYSNDKQLLLPCSLLLQPRARKQQWCIARDEYREICWTLHLIILMITYEGSLQNLLVLVGT